MNHNFAATPTTRAIIARSFAGSAAAEFAEHRWGRATAVAQALKAANPGNITVADTLPSAPLGSDFMDLFAEQSLFGRVFGDRLWPFAVRMLKLTGGAHGAWVTEAKPIPLSKPSLSSFILKPLKVGTIVALTKESLETPGPAIELHVERAIINALDAAIAESLLDPANAGVVDTSPASLTNGVTPVGATADPRADLAALIAAFGGDLSQAIFVTDPTIGAQLALARDATGNALYPDAGPRGGSLLGMPLLTSRFSPSGQISLVDPTGVAAAIERIEVQRSEVATLEASDDPGNAGAGAVMISLWQSDLVALKGTVYCNWANQRSGGVALITGADY